MKFSIPANWEEDFFDAIDFTAVGEVFGKLNMDVVGGGRSAAALFRIPRRVFETNVRAIRRRGVAFNYLLNATCLDNKEFTRKGHRAIRRLLDYLSSCEVDMVTLALPQLVVLVKKHYPEFKVSISTNAMVDNMERVRYWEELGADQITLSYSDVNRNFPELRRITRHARCDVQTICNLICRKNCPYQALHGNFASHASQRGHVNHNFAFDYYCYTCIARFFSNPVEIMRASWIRPEDVRFYEEAGLKKLKLVERGLKTAALARIVKAYTERSYDGNFMDLLPSMSKYQTTARPRPTHLLRYLFHPGKYNVAKVARLMAKLARMKPNTEWYHNLGIHIENKELDGFLNKFVQNNCADTFCDECGHCRRWAQKVVRVVEPQRGEVRPEEILRQLARGFATGELL